MSANIQTVFDTQSFSGRNGAGAISVSGLKVGDIVLVAVQNGNPAEYPPNTPFENIVSVADEIQQTNGSDLTSNTYVLVLFRGV